LNQLPVLTKHGSIWMALLAVLISVSGCGQAKTLASQADKMVTIVEEMFQQQGVEYKAEAVSTQLINAYDALLALEQRATGPEEVNAIGLSKTRLKSFLGLLLMNTFESSRPVAKLPPGYEGLNLKDVRVLRGNLPQALKFYESNSPYLATTDIARYYQNLQQQLPDYSFAYSALATFTAVYGDWTETQRLAEAALELNPRDFFALRTMIMGLFARGERGEYFETLLTQYKEVIPNAFMADYVLSTTAKERGDLDSAIEFADRALSKIRNVNLIVYLAKLHEENGNIERARYTYAQLLGISKYAGKPLYRYAEKEVARLAQLMKEEERKEKNQK